MGDIDGDDRCVEALSLPSVERRVEVVEGDVCEGGGQERREALEEVARTDGSSERSRNEEEETGGVRGGGFLFFTTSSLSSSLGTNDGGAPILPNSSQDEGDGSSGTEKGDTGGS